MQCDSALLEVRKRGIIVIRLADDEIAGERMVKLDNITDFIVGGCARVVWSYRTASRHRAGPERAGKSTEGSNSRPPLQLRGGGEEFLDREGSGV